MTASQERVVPCNLELTETPLPRIEIVNVLDDSKEQVVPCNLESTTAQVHGIVSRNLEMATAQFASLQPEVLTQCTTTLSNDESVCTEESFLKLTRTGSLLSSHRPSVLKESALQRTEIVNVLADSKEQFGGFVTLSDLARSQQTVVQNCVVCSVELDEDKCCCQHCNRFVCVPWAKNTCCTILRGLQSFFNNKTNQIDWSLVEGLPLSELYASIGVLCKSCMKTLPSNDYAVLFKQYEAKLALLTGPFTDVLCTFHPGSFDEEVGAVEHSYDFGRTDGSDNCEDDIFGKSASMPQASKPPSECLFNRYIKGMRLPGAYAHNLELYSAVVTYDRPLVVFFSITKFVFSVVGLPFYTYTGTSARS